MSSVSMPLPERATASPILRDIDQVLRDSAAILERIRDSRDLPGLARAMLLAILLGGAVFGAALGGYRGGAQIAYAALKLPLVILFTAAICAPALTAVNAALGRPSNLRSDLALVLTSLGLGSLVIAAEAPVIILAGMLGVGYHDVALLTVGCCAVGGLAGLVFLIRGLSMSERRGRFSAALALLAVFGLAGAQMTWTLRPYLVRPKTLEVPFLRSVEGNLAEATLTAFDSARGIYREDAWPDDPEAYPDSNGPCDPHYATEEQLRACGLNGDADLRRPAADVEE
jgi:hypothetical protein